MARQKEIWITLPVRRPFKNIFQIKITLLETDPPVWRRIQIPETFTFYDLHVAIQNAMGWTDSHLHLFEIEYDDGPEKRVRIDAPYCVEDIEGDRILLTTEVALSEYFCGPGDKMMYTYDFGDNWKHEVILEEVFHRELKVKYPRCLAGELACPPEDCGGVPGYYECIKALKKHDNSHGLLEWLGSWRPEGFNPKKVVFESPRKRLKDSLS